MPARRLFHLTKNAAHHASNWSLLLLDLPSSVVRRFNFGFLQLGLGPGHKVLLRNATQVDQRVACSCVARTSRSA